MDACENCKFFSLIHPDNVGGRRWFGECRIHPPRAAKISSSEASFPLVNSKTWCGEYKPRAEGATPMAA